MIKDLPIIKLFKNDNKYYVYDTFTNSILHITRSHYNQLKIMSKIGINEYISNGSTSYEYNDILSLMRVGFFKPCFIEKIEHPDVPKIYDLVSQCLNYLLLQVTRDCNFDCIYCHYANSAPIDRNHSPEQMSLPVAKEAVDFLYNHSKSMDFVNIGFYGGEPLLNFSLIKEIVEYSQAKFETKNIKYNITTNASLLTKDIINFLIQYDFSVLVSLDGPQEIQNRHRRYRYNLNNTYDIVMKNLKRIKDINVSYYQNKVRFNPVIMPDEDSDMIVNYFFSLGISPEKCNFLPANLSGIDYFYQHNSRQDIERGNKNIYLNYKNNSNILLRYKNKSRVLGSSHHSGPCVPMVSRFFVNCYGDIFICEKIIESESTKLGNVKDALSIDLKKIEAMLNIGKLSEQQCRNCYAFKLCSICAISCVDPEDHSICSKQKKEACQKMRNTVDKFLLDYVNKGDSLL